MVSEIYMDIIERYMKMGAGQFLRDFRRDYNIKKTIAHRKAVFQRKKKADEKKMKVHLQQIWNDRSSCKKTSHARFIALVSKLTHKGLYTIYTKGQLQQRCMQRPLSRTLEQRKTVFRVGWGDIATK